MCGRFQLKKDEKSDALFNALQVSGQAHYADDIAPGAQISIIAAGRKLQMASWWLLLEADSLKPNYRYASFNSRSDKLNRKGSLAYEPYRKSRCIIPASAFVEGLGDKKTYHKIELADRAIAFGGLYREYVNREDREIVYAASIITLPPVAKWANIHPKSIPLMLDYEDATLIDRWLDPAFSAVEKFDDVLQPDLHQTQRITPIDRPSRWQATGPSYLLS